MLLEVSLGVVLLMGPVCLLLGYLFSARPDSSVSSLGLLYLGSFAVALLCLLALSPFVVSLVGVTCGSVGQLPRQLLFAYTEWEFFQFDALASWQLGLLLAVAVPTLLFFFLFSAQPGLLSGAAIAALLLTLFSGCSLLFTQQLVVFFVSFELLLLGALFLLKFTSKSERVDEAVAEMAFWTLLGSLGLLAGFLPLFVQGCATFGDLHPGQVSPLFVGLLCCGFGVKVPLWPCFSWLLRAHVEASTEYSIMLSGVILKFGLFGLFRVLSVLGGGVVGYVVAALALIGLLEASVRILGQRDLKRVVALTTVVELNWAAFSLALGGAVFEHVALFVCLAHSVTTATEFYLVDCISRRFGSRDLALVSGLAHATPQLFAVSVLTFLVTVGFPGTSIFLCKLYFFTALLNLAVGPWFCLCLVFFFWLPAVFYRVWTPVWFGYSAARPCSDLSLRDWAVFGLLLGLSCCLGVIPGLFSF